MWPQLRSTLVVASTLATASVPVPGPAAHARPVPSPSAAAAVTVASFSFTPSRVVVAPGDAVTWTFSEPVMSHTTTSDDGFWTSGPRSAGATYTRTFATAGRYRYHCAIHPFMHGRVVVPVTVTGSPTQGWRLRWASTMPAHWTVDVQVRRPGSTRWSALRTATTRLGTRFHPARAGTYALRARSHRRAHTSGWSPVRTIQVS
jgi:plastocyanin